MTDVQEFCLRWNNHQSNLVSAFYDLKLGEDFVDVTLACEGQSLQAHKVVLSACSPFFRELLKSTPCKHPVIVLKDMLYQDLLALVEYMYMGEVRVKHHGLPSFLRTAEALCVRGLIEPSSKLKTSNLTASSDNSKTLKVANLSVCPSGSKSSCRNDVVTPQMHTQQIHVEGSLDSAAFSSSNCADVACRDSLAEAKVEEIDLDSDEDDNIMGHTTTTLCQGIATENERDALQAEEGQNQPSLTLQSFARIPVLETSNQDQEAILDFDLRQSTIEIPVNLESDNLLGRTPGRMSSSDRPRWPCPFCMRLLSSRSSVRRHIEDRHTSDTSRHPCPLCERLYRTRNSLQYHLSTAHRDREPGPRGRPRTRPRTPSTTESSIQGNKSPIEGMSSSNTFVILNSGPTGFGFPPA